MGLLDQLLGAATSSNPSAGATSGIQSGLLSHVLGMVESQGTGGLAGLVDKLKAGGLGSAVDSWVGNGPNQSISPAQVSSALGQGQISQLAQKCGIPPEAVAGHLSQILPEVINHLTPNGTVPTQGLAATAIGMLRGKLMGQ